MAEILKANGERVSVEPENGTDFKLAELQKIVGGYAEVAHLGGGKILIVNEDGQALGLPYNAQATALYRHFHIVGDALLCESRQVR